MLAEHRACLRERLWSCYSDEAPQTKNVHSLQSKSSKNKRYKFREMEKLATFPTLSASVTVWLLPCRLKSSIELVCAVSVVCRSSVLTLPLFADRGEQAGAGQQVNADNHHEPAECPGRRPPPAARVPRRPHHVSTPHPQPALQSDASTSRADSNFSLHFCRVIAWQNHNVPCLFYSAPLPESHA